MIAAQAYAIQEIEPRELGLSLRRVDFNGHLWFASSDVWELAYTLDRKRLFLDYSYVVRKPMVRLAAYMRLPVEQVTLRAGQMGITSKRGGIDHQVQFINGGCIETWLKISAITADSIATVLIAVLGKADDTNWEGVDRQKTDAPTVLSNAELTKKIGRMGKWAVEVDKKIAELSASFDAAIKAAYSQGYKDSAADAAKAAYARAKAIEDRT